MRLGDMLRDATETSSSTSPMDNGTWSESSEHIEDPLIALKQRARDRLFERLGQRLYDQSLSQERLNDFVLSELDIVMRDEAVALNADERHSLVSEIAGHVMGLGPIELFLDDPDITEIMVNGNDYIFVEKAGLLHQTDARFMTHEHLRQVIERIVSHVGRRIDESSPMVDARLPDGSRVNAIIPPLAVDGPVLTIRKFSHRVLGVNELVERGTMSPAVADFMRAAVEGKLNILVSGGTGTGKTTLLNVLSSFVPDVDRVITIEDAVELRLHQRHVIRLESRPTNVEGRGQITIRDLVRNSLRMRPDRIIVGEVRGGEALDMLQAMNTGHEGSLSTLHANSPRDALARLETMVLMAGIDLPVRAIREQVASALDLVVHLSRLRDGTRRITRIDEVTGMEGDRITISTLFSFDTTAGIDSQGQVLGSLHPTGLRPTFSDRLLDEGIELSSELFGEQLGVIEDYSRARTRR